MRIQEIIKEDRQKVNEVAFLAIPFLGSITIGGLLGAVSAVLTVMDIVEIYKLSSKLAKNPESMTEDDYQTLFIDVVFMIPALKYVPKAAKGMITKAIPDSWKKAGGEKVKDIIQSKANKAGGTTKIDPKTGKPEIDPKTGKPATGKPDEKKTSTWKKVGVGAAGGLAGAAAVDSMLGGTEIGKKVKSTIGGAFVSVAGTNFSGNNPSTIDGGSISKDDPLYKYARWFGRTT